ncbi:hypothetical protein [Mucilaginibacter pedocola]|nr:hypothetical protein [Mucilaginibacter pedocola]
MKKVCLALLILLTGIISSCVKTTTTKAIDVILKPTVGIRKDIATAD